MSHVVTTESDKASQRFTNLDIVDASLARCGGGAHLVRNARDFRYYSDNRHPCQHKIIVPQYQRYGRDTEIGLVPSEKYPGSFSLAYDPDSLYGSNVLGKSGDPLCHLQMFYELESAKKVAVSQGYSWEEKLEPDGSLTCRAQNLMATV